MNEFAYRANFVAQLIQSMLSLGTALGGLAVVFSHTDSLAGWRPAELLALTGVFILVRAFIHTAITSSLYQLMDDVRQGTLDFTLTKPEDAQVLVSVRQVQVWETVNVVIGLCVLVAAAIQLGDGIDVRRALLFIATLLASTSIVYSFLLMLATCSFWLVRVENLLTIFNSLYEAGRWPVGLYPPWLRWILTFLMSP
jgi:ABC-2 type transport system permease protein